MATLSDANPACYSLEGLESRWLLSRFLASPGLLALVDNLKPQVELSWDASPGAASYLIQRRTSQSQRWVTLKSIPAGTDAYLDAGVRPGRFYAFAITAIGKGVHSHSVGASAFTYVSGMPYNVTSFGEDGYATWQPLISGDGVAVTPDGQRVFTFGNTHSGNYTGGYDPQVLVYDSSGNFDSTFSGGFLDPNSVIPTPFTWVQAVAVQADGKLLVEGDCSTGVAIARFNSNGTLDTTFNQTGEVITSAGGGGALAVGAGGTIYIGGTMSSGSFFAERFTASGSVDTTFGSDGIVESGVLSPPVGSTSAQLYATAMAVDPVDGSAVVVGEFSQVNAQGSYEDLTAYAARMTPSGNAVSFSIEPNSSSAGPTGVVVDSNQRIIVVGFYSSSSGFATRYRPDGAVDGSWVNPSGWNLGQAIAGVAQLSDGSYVIVGGSDVARLSGADGQLIGGVVDSRLVDSSDRINADYEHVVAGPSDRFFVSGLGYSSLMVSAYAI